MPHQQLDKLVAVGDLKVEPPSREELDGLIRSGDTRLRDAENENLAIESRFDLAYNAAHALSLAALRWHGYRPANKRYIVFLALAHTLALPAAQWRVLADAHRQRNVIEYEGLTYIDQALLNAVLRVTREVAQRVHALGPLNETV